MTDKNSNLKIVESETPNPDAPNTDGRRNRSERSKKRIVDAMLALLRAGDMHPSAAKVAEQAEVSLRTVFRHFEEMDNLNREMTAIMEAEIMPALFEPFISTSWREQLSEMIGRRAKVYERVMPVRIAGAIKRFRSSFLMDNYNRSLGLETAGLKAILPDHITEDALLFSALEMSLSFDSWRRLRQDQKLSQEKAEATLHYMVEKLIPLDAN